MRTNIDIDDDLMDEVMKKGSFKTKKEAVNKALRLLARREHQREIREYRGKLQWSGDLDEMRTNL